MSVETAPRGATAVVTTSNGGPDLRGVDLGLLVRRFTRGHATQPTTRGFGLGLSIVQAVVDAHKGRLELSTLPSGGLSFAVTLPARDGYPPSRMPARPD